ncbi:MAG: O-methyltransferase [Planctomycetes bacterium]|nr:O-methyltransferase [Planctomycetota bacterium]
MSADDSLVTARHFAYLAERTRGDDDFLRQLKEAAAEVGIPKIWIGPAQASFMQILLELQRAKDVVEVGTLAGYSAISMARALPDDGHVHTIELSPKHADFAAEWIARSDVADKITLHRGAGSDVLATLPPISADAIFLDADKSGYPAYLAEGLRILRPGGLVMADNAFAFGQLFDERPSDREVGAVRAFNDVMAKEPRVHGCIVPLGDGLWVGVVEGA